MENINAELSNDGEIIAELRLSLSHAEHQLSIAEKKNISVLNELKIWRQRALRTEESLKQEKRINEGNITQLGFKMLQFENQLRKEQREIERKFLEKDQQIKILQDVINSLHSKIKTNSLCYNCFMVKHNSAEQNISPDSFVAKFPLDMDFTDHKNVSHNAHEPRSRNISLPLNMQSPNESPRSSGEFCFHHMLSPVPEELENNFLEHAKRENAHYSAIEEEEEDEQEEDEERGEKEKVPIIEEECNNQVSIQEKKIEERFVVESHKETGITKAHWEACSAKDKEECGPENQVQDLSDLKAEEPLNSVALAYDSDKVEDKKSEQTDQSLGRSDNSCVRDGMTQPPAFQEEESSEIKSLMNELIGRVEHDKTVNELTNLESVDSMDFEKDVSFRNEGIEAESYPPDQGAADKMALSPKSEALVSELKRAIFEASLEVEKSNDLVKQNSLSNFEDIVECKQDSISLFETSESNMLHADSNTVLVSPKEEAENGKTDTSMVNIEEIDLELAVEGLRTNISVEDASAVDRVMEKAVAKKSESCSDALTDYDVIELE